jgi:hypothetical protein
MIKIGIWIPKIEYVSGWIETQIITELSKFVHVNIYCPNFQIYELIKSKSAEILHKNIDLRIVEIQEPSKISKIFFKVRTFNRRKSNKSFEFYYKRAMFGEMRIFPKPFKFYLLKTSSIVHVKHMIKFIVKYPYLIVALIPKLNIFYEYLLKKLHDRQQAIFPDGIDRDIKLLIIVSGNRELRSFALIKAMKIYGIKTFISTQNWDNLTSKTFLNELPDLIGVMGNNCIKQVANTQKIESAIIRPCGLPRFNPYRNISPDFSAVKKDKYSILYLGTSLPHNEINIVNDLFKYLINFASHRNIIFNYKPHPNRRPRYFEEKLIPDLALNSEKTENYPTIDNMHISQILSSDLIISAPTTMVIEAMLLGKNIILDLSDDGIHRTTSAIAFKSFLHYESLKSIQNLKKAHSYSDLLTLLKLELDFQSFSRLEYNIDDLIENKEVSYSNHILKMI